MWKRGTGLMDGHEGDVGMGQGRGIGTSAGMND